MEKKTILVADDDNDTRDIVSQAVELMGCIAVQARDGTHACSLVSQCLPDLAILDVMMPGCSGTEVCDLIKRTEGGQLTPVIMLTAKDSVKDKVSALEGGADDYLTKPFIFQELQARIKSLLRIRDLNLHLQEKNRQLESMQEKLVKSERQLAVMQLAGSAAHELGQPVSAILLNCHLVQTLPADDSRSQRAVQAIRDDARRMVTMLEKLRSADAEKTEQYYNQTEILDLKGSGLKDSPKDKTAAADKKKG